MNGETCIGLWKTVISNFRRGAYWCWCWSDNRWDSRSLCCMRWVEETSHADWAEL